MQFLGVLLLTSMGSWPGRQTAGWWCSAALLLAAGASSTGTGSAALGGFFALDFAFALPLAGRGSLILLVFSVWLPL